MAAVAPIRAGNRDPEKEKYWLAVMRRWQASGLNQSQFCRQENVPDARFFYWHKELKKRKLIEIAGTTAKKEGNGRPVFLPVEVKPVQDLQKRNGGQILEITTPGGYVVRIP